MVACEDTRRTGVLLERHGIAAPLVSFHEHNERARAEELVARIARRRSSSRSCPTPARRWSPIRASRSCAACLARGLAVEVLPGPSAVLTALVASGLPVERWRFVGFLPRRAGRARALLARRRGDARRVRVAAARWRRRSRCSPSATRSARWRSAAS